MLNWLTRYAVVCDELVFDAGGALTESVLDVGCGPHGLASALPTATFAGVDVAFGETTAPTMVAFRSEPGPLPFADRAFDTVVCLDVLEHVPPADREAFVADLARVAARRALVACPSNEAEWVDDVLRAGFAAHGVPAPDWMNEHDEFGVPSAQEIRSWCAGVDGCDARELTMTNGLLSGLAVIADILPSLAERGAAEYAEHRRQWLDLFRAGRFGSCYRKGYAIERRAPSRAIVAAARLDETVWDAVRCPACGATGARPGDRGPACRACGHATRRDPSGAWDLTGARQPSRPPDDGPPAPIPSGAPPTLPAAPPAHATAILNPSGWGRPLTWLPTLSAHIAAIPADADVTLVLDARGADLDPHTVRQMVSRACEYLGEGADFAPIVLLEGTVETPAGARPVAGPAELLELAGRAAPPTDQTPAAITDHAIWAKGLVDELQAEIDRARYRSAAPAEFRGQPLVTVRIPTYGSTDDLINRAIPSVLAGQYQNIELLVCSDGPQPHARAAVAAVGDARVRYMELAERPSYPSWPENFWRIAGACAVNRLLDEARGAFIAALDHDDGFTYDHIPKLMGALHRNDADFVYGQAMTEWPGGDWRLHGTAPMVYGEVIHATVMYSSRLAHMRYDTDAWLLDEPVDWNLWRRMRDMGAAMTHLPEPVAVHFKERSSIDHRPEDPGADLAVRADDVLATSARALLDVARRGQPPR
ncbi:MAG TPA: glycosyltransferase [Solirubrobacteraceae bacterium]|nr:glycosyltransferase [Solirubrobacteraceae bacterium]